MRRIARDETRHAARAAAIDAWVSGRLEPKARRRVQLARRDAGANLAASTGDLPLSVRLPLGLPSRGHARALAVAMVNATA